MTFTAWYYPFFLAIVAILYWQVPYRARLLLLLSASYFFYAYWDLKFLSLILASTAMDFLCGRAIDGHRSSLKLVISAGGLFFATLYIFLWKTSPERRRKKFFILTLTYNLGLLGFFKYFNFFIDQARIILEAFGFATNGLALSILLPVGISFYTFQSISYASDIYLKKEKSTRWKS